MSATAEREAAPPFDAAEMSRLRLALRKTPPTDGLGAHLRRRGGQSLEFREHRDYAFGDDVRTIDWMASLRRGEGKRVVRVFEAEERRSLLLLLDTRPAMRLPEGFAKLRVGAWIAQCLAHAALAEGDAVTLGLPFEPPPSPPRRLRRTDGLARLREAAERLLSADLSEEDWAREPRFAAEALRPLLRPASAVVLISDMLFADAESDFARFAREAQAARRSFHIAEIDSWPIERARLARGPVRLGGLEGRGFADGALEVDEALLEEAGKAMERHRDALRRRAAGPGLIWPARALRCPADADAADMSGWFRREFPRAPFVHALISRVSA